MDDLESRRLGGATIAAAEPGNPQFFPAAGTVSMAASRTPDADEIEVLPDPGSPENRLRCAEVLSCWRISAGFVLLACAPWLWRVSGSLWSRTHYQGFPLILAGFAYLLRHRIPDVAWPASRRLTARIALLVGAGAGILAAAVVWNSAWLGLVACLVLQWSLVRFYAGAGAVHFRGPFLFLAMMIPLPMDLDQALIVRMQKVATRAASVGLDYLQIMHTVSGVAIRTPGKSYLVKEACSGIQSLFAALAATGFCCVMARYGVMRTTLLLVAAAFWVVFANALRVFAIVVCDVQFGVALDNGWLHEALGLATYAVAISLILSTDQLIRFVFPVLRDQWFEAHMEFEYQVRKPLRQFMDRWFDQPALSEPWTRRAQWLAVAAVIAAVSTGIARHALASRTDRPPVEVQNPSTSGPLQRMSSVTMPERFGDFELVGFEKQERTSGDPFGLISWQWSYRREGVSALISVDGYYPDWHRLGGCYQAIGWDVESSSNKGLPRGEGEANPGQSGDVTAPETLPHTEYVLRRNSLTFGFLVYTCFDSRLDAVTPPELSQGLISAFRQRLQRSSPRVVKSEGIQPPVFQVQLLAETDRRLQPAEQQEVLQLFDSARRHLLRSLADVQSAGDPAP